MQVLAGCVRRHGENWLWKPVRQVSWFVFFLLENVNAQEKRLLDAAFAGTGESYGGVSLCHRNCERLHLKGKPCIRPAYQQLQSHRKHMCVARFEIHQSASELYTDELCVTPNYNVGGET